LQKDDEMTTTQPLCKNNFRPTHCRLASNQTATFTFDEVMLRKSNRLWGPPSFLLNGYRQHFAAD